MIAVTLLCIAASLLGAPETAWNPAVLPLARDGVAAALGNGLLSAGLDARGNLRTFFWPGPGGNNQLAAEQGGQSCAGFFLGLRGQVISLADPAWQVESQCDLGLDRRAVETRLVLPDTGVHARQIALVEESADALSMQIAVSGTAEAPRIFWYQDFDPKTVRIPEVAWCGALNRAGVDFAAFLMSAPTFRGYQFRPAAPSAAQRHETRSLLQASTAVGPDLAALWGATVVPSVWVGLSSPNRPIHAACGNVGEADGPLAQVRQGRIGETAAAVGDCDVAVELEPQSRGEEYSVTLRLAFGANRKRVDELLDAAAEATFDPPVVAESDVERQRARALTTLLHAIDRATGAVVRAPVAEPAQPIVSAEVTAWVSLALDLAGRHNQAADALRFLRNQVRLQSTPGQPSGSLASAYYADGVPASPHWVLEPEAVAWLLSGLWRHGALLSESEKKAWFEESWDAARASADFLEQWTSGPGGTPLPGYDPSQGRDAVRDVSILHHLMGINAAIRMNAVLGRKMVDPWIRHRDELDNQLRSKMLGGLTSALCVPETLPFWLRGVLENERDAVWNASAIAKGESRTLGAFSFGPTTEWTRDAGVDAYAAALAYIALQGGMPTEAAPQRPPAG